MKRITSGRRVFYGVLGLALLATGMVYLWYRYAASPSKFDFRLRRGEYEAIVRKAQTLMPSPSPDEAEWSKPVHLYTDGGIYASELSRERKCEDMTGFVQVSRLKAGHTQVSIITRDLGHMGTYGYVYSETPNEKPETELPSLREQIDPHWWIAYNDQW